jgi:hypothetical protein
MNTTTLSIGDFVRCSDGTPQPPAHHKKKLRHWQCHNFTGWVHSLDPKWNRVGIDKDGSKCLVLVMNAATHTITKIEQPAAATAAPESPATPVMHKKSYSPWGKVDGHTPFGDLGLYHHSTPSHGGIYVPDEMLARMPAPYRDGNWYEEDCEWAKVALSFPSGVTDEDLECARKTAINWFPHEFMKVTGETLAKEQSHVLMEEHLREYAKDKHVVVSAWGSWYKDRSPIPDGMVGCFAVLGGRNERGGYDESTGRYFLVPAAEYDTRTSFGFIIEKDHPAWPAAGEPIQPARKSRVIDSAAASALIDSLVA